MPEPTVRLVPFTDEWLPVLRPWFEHPEVQKWLGGPDWLGNALRMLTGFVEGEEFRGAAVLARFGFVSLDTDDNPVGYIDGDIYDRETRYVGGGIDGPLFEDASPVHRPVMGIAIVIDPARWREGYGQATIRALLAHPGLAHVPVVKAGIEPENIASRRLVESAGFRPESDEPDWEGILNYHLERTGEKSRME